MIREVARAQQPLFLSRVPHEQDRPLGLAIERRDPLQKARIAPETAQHAGPRFAEDKFSAGIARNGFAFVVHDFGDDPEEG